MWSLRKNVIRADEYYLGDHTTMLLSDKRILEERENGNIVIEPFDRRHLGTNSYDCRLGEW